MSVGANLGPKAGRVARGSTYSGSKEKPVRESSPTLRSVKLATAKCPIEEFLTSGLLPVPDKADSKVLEVPHSEPLSSVVSQLHRKRLGSCMVSLANGQKDIFDCFDFSSYLLEAVFGATPRGSGSDDWGATKKKLQKIAEQPVVKAIRGGRRLSSGTKAPTSSPSAASDSADKVESFAPCDASKSLKELLHLLRAQRLVPVYRGKDLIRVVTATDILEMCLRLSEEHKSQLNLHFSELISKSPGMLSKLEIFDDQTTLEAMRLMREAGTHVMPILSNSMDHVVSTVSGHLSGSAGSEDARRVVGQFDVAMLRVLFARSAQDEARSPWWWEDESITTNIFLESCMDFVSMGPSAVTSEVPPYAAVLSEEPVARAISRAVASSYQSVVVYRVESGKGVIAKPVSSKPLEGVASAQGIVLAMLDAGLFSTLAFDPSKPRRQAEKARRPTLTPADVQTVLNANEEPDRRSKVTFNNVIALEQLCIPTCPDHGAYYMRYTKEDTINAMDFPALKDWVPEAKALGAVAACLACGRRLGQISKLAEPARKGPGPRPPRGSSGSKDSDPDKGNGLSRRKSGSNNRGSRTGKGDADDGSRSFFGFCCVGSCQQFGNKDKIHADAPLSPDGKPERSPKLSKDAPR